MSGLRRFSRVTIAVAILAAMSGGSLPASAETAGQSTTPIDVCQSIDDALAQIGKQTSPTDPALATQHALQRLSNQPALVTVKMEGDTVAGPGVTTASIEDKRIDALPDLSKICVKVYRLRGKWELAPIRQTQLAEKPDKSGKRINVTFEIAAPDSAALFQPPEIRHLLALDMADGKSPTLLNFSTTLTVRSWLWGLVGAILLAIGSYAAIAWATFKPEDAGTLRQIPWLLFVLHPVRISSASYGEASMSQLQVLLFTLIVGALLFYLWFATLILSDISADLLKLIGISAVGAVGSRFAHTLKTTPNDQTARYLIGKGWYNWNEVDVQELATFRKLLLTDDRLDVYKFQIAIFTIIVALYVIFAGKNGLSDVKISETMLYLIGISQGVYVAGKAVTDRTTDLDAAVQKMIDLEPQIRAKEAALAAGAPRPPDLVALDQQYERAAITAAEEFSSLQHRLYPSDAAGGGWTKDLTHINPAVKRP
jgi:hypothetical protein